MIEQVFRFYTKLKILKMYGLMSKNTFQCDRDNPVFAEIAHLSEMTEPNPQCSANTSFVEWG